MKIFVFNGGDYSISHRVPNMHGFLQSPGTGTFPFPSAICVEEVSRGEAGRCTHMVESLCWSEKPGRSGRVLFLPVGSCH